jgi:hypothetical protein
MKVLESADAELRAEFFQLVLGKEWNKVYWKNLTEKERGEIRNGRDAAEIRPPPDYTILAKFGDFNIEQEEEDELPVDGNWPAYYKVTV